MRGFMCGKEGKRVHMWGVGGFCVGRRVRGFCVGG